jgi:hypothetical protein
VAQLVFGQFNGKWAWRVEWTDAQGTFRTKDFVQKDLQPGVAWQDAKTFKDDLQRQLAA